MRWKICEKHEAVFEACSRQLTRLLRLSAQDMQVEPIILLDSPIWFDMNSYINFAILRHLCLIDFDIDFELLIDTLHLMGNLVQLYINNKNWCAECEHRWQTDNKRRFNKFKVFHDIIRSKRSLQSLELVGVNWSTKLNPREDLSLGYASKLDRLVLNETLSLENIYLCQVAAGLPNLKHMYLKYDLFTQEDQTTKESFRSLKRLTVSKWITVAIYSLKRQDNKFSIHPRHSKSHCLRSAKLTRPKRHWPITHHQSCSHVSIM